MDHNLEDSLNLESSMGEMDFESSHAVVSQADITLDAGSHVGDITMEFEQIEEQPILMDSGNEEIIVSDFMGDQFNLQEYSIQDDQTSEMTTVEDSNLSSRSETMIDLQLESEHTTQTCLEAKEQPQYLAVRAAPSVHASTSKKSESMMITTVPRQVAIAPKPPRLVPIAANRFPVPQTKQIAIAPKPVALVANKPNLKKISLSNVVQGGAKGNTVLAQIGKQLVVMPSGSSQKIKLVTTKSALHYVKAAGGTDQALLIPNTNVTDQQTNNPVKAKVIQLQGQSNYDIANQPAIITKILPKAKQPTRYVMRAKAVPISIGNKVLMGSPTSQGVKFTEKQLISIKSAPKLTAATATSTDTILGSATKKVVITANPSKNVILKTTAPPKTTQFTKDGKVVVQGQKSQLHQINVPGKGIQYIRLITNQTPTTSQGATKLPGTSVNVPSKTLYMSDSKGNLVPVAARKTIAGQPASYVWSGRKPTNKWPQKLMKIEAAPAPAKATPISISTVRSAQSLLAPLSPVDMESSSDFSVMQEQSPVDHLEVEVEALTEEIEHQSDEGQDDEEESMDGTRDSESSGVLEDSKASLRQLLAAPHQPPSEPRAAAQIPVDNENMNSMDPGNELSQEQPLIVISSNYVSQEDTGEPDARASIVKAEEEPSNMLSMDTDLLNTYQPSSPTGDNDITPNDLAYKPRRACNCTKSQCLKLYCDCFANGEFCNLCSCNNCHNNLDHEDLRQRAIRACLERNPNAFRPKIGKTKAGGPEIIRRHYKGCNCKRSGCLKNYCECYEAKIACTGMCRCVGCRNVQDGGPARRRPAAPGRAHADHARQPCTFMTTEVIEAVCQCLLAAAADGPKRPDPDPVRDVVDEFSRCLQDIIGASHHQLLDQARA